MKASNIERSVDSLQNIYAIIVALAIGQSINSSIHFNNGKLDWQLFFSTLPALISFFFFLVPFYHGMNRHLDVCYIERNVRNVRGALLIDFTVFCLEASLLFIFTQVLLQNLTGFLIIGLMLFIDMLWAAISHWIHYRNYNPSVVRWAIINFVTLTFGFIIWSFNFFENKALVLMTISIMRTAADYFFCWEFYFPR